MKTTTYIKRFTTEEAAYSWMVMKNRASAKDIFCLVPGEDNNFAVVDLCTAIDLGLGYKWSK